MRIATLSMFGRVLFGMQGNRAASLRAQEQLASGRRLLRPSDDPAAAARALRLERQLADASRFRDAVRAGRSALEIGASELQQGSGLVAEARELFLQALNGTMTADDRRSVADELELVRTQLLEVANARAGERWLFGGTATDSPPFVEVSTGGETRVVYRGDRAQQEVLASEGVSIPITLPGSDVFGRFEPQGASFEGATGAASGATADEGSGYVNLTLRHDATDGSALAGSGIALVAGGAKDSLLGPNELVVDPVAGTIRLGEGPALSLPDPADPSAADFVVRNELGGELHLDLSGHTGAAFSGSVTGLGSIALEGGSFVPLDFADGDLELSDEERGLVLHVDATGIRRAGQELVTFAGATNVFDVLGAAVRDLRNEDGLEVEQVLDRLAEKLTTLDGHHEDLLAGIGALGARSQRLAVTDGHLQSVEVGLQGFLSDARDADLAEAALELARSETLLQVAQASGARLIQTSLLNYLG